MIIYIKKLKNMNSEKSVYKPFESPTLDIFENSKLNTHFEIKRKVDLT